LTVTNIPTLSADTAIALVQAVVAEAARQGLRIAVCACDAQGHDLVTLRMDAVTPPILGFARDKAYTAATMRRSTAAFAERMGSSPSLSLGLSTRPRLLPWGGGVPVVMDGRVIGGLGVSGATDAEDIACAEAALATLGLGWQV
jgi:uncharacterized protein GlcG (DUF336 family)